MRNGFTFLHRISWDSCNEAEDLIPQAKIYKQQHGCYLERICADRIYINTKNQNFCTRNNIRLSGKRLGRPPKDPEANAAHKVCLYQPTVRSTVVAKSLWGAHPRFGWAMSTTRLSRLASWRANFPAPPPAIDLHFACSMASRSARQAVSAGACPPCSSIPHHQKPLQLPSDHLPIQLRRHPEQRLTAFALRDRAELLHQVVMGAVGVIVEQDWGAGVGG